MYLMSRVISVTIAKDLLDPIVEKIGDPRKELERMLEEDEKKKPTEIELKVSKPSASIRKAMEQVTKTPPLPELLKEG